MLHYIKPKILDIPILLHHKYTNIFLISLCSICSSAVGGMLIHNNDCYAAVTSNATAAITLGESKLYTTVTQGDVAYLSSTITATASDIENYTLSITGPVGLKGTTAITGAGNKTPANMANNSWGYAYNQSGNNSSKTYSSFTGSAQTLESGTTPSGTAKNITFAAKFGDNAVAGHYQASVTVSLVATPKLTLVYAEGFPTITNMQQMTPAICNAADYWDYKDLKDTRDNNTYRVVKFQDGRCWMTSNLRITSRTIQAADSDFSSGSITLPSSSKADFNDANKFTYRSILLSEANSGSTGYYNWYTATAGAGNSSFTANNQSVNTSICPKGWTIPTGGTTSDFSTVSTWTNFYGLFRNMGLTISNSLYTNSYTLWGTGDLAIVQNNIYNFKYTGDVYDGSLHEGTAQGFWWSRTAGDTSDSAYYLVMNGSLVRPGGNTISRYRGFAVRCIARN